ncbi:putative uDENN domain protein, partial [Tanacetum coccineum]
VDGTLALSAVSAGIIEDVLTSPSKLRINSPNNRNSDASDKRWEYLGKVHDDHDSIRKAGIEACVVPVTPKLGRIGSSGPLFSSVRGIVTEDEDGVLSCSGKDATDKTIMEWAKENKNDLLQIVCSYHDLPVPKYGGKVYFKPFEHLQAIEYYRTAFAFGEDPDVDMSLIPDKVKFKLAAIEEAVSLSNWTTITLCRALSLQNVLILLAAVLLEKQVIITSPNLGVLSATVLSLIPMILPFEWQSLFLPVLPGKMFEFLDAPVPFVVGILHKPADNKMKMSNNLVHVDLDDNQVEMSSLPALPKQRELMTRLGPLHARLSSDKTSAKKHPVYRCNKWQIDAATQFLAAMRQHLESLCSNLSNHTITNVQNNDRVSLLLKESYIDSFSYRDRPFVRELYVTLYYDTDAVTPGILSGIDIRSAIHGLFISTSENTFITVHLLDLAKDVNRWELPGPMHLLMPTGPFPKDPAPGNELSSCPSDLISQEVGLNPGHFLARPSLTGQLSVCGGEMVPSEPKAR